MNPGDYQNKQFSICRVASKTRGIKSLFACILFLIAPITTWALTWNVISPNGNLQMVIEQKNTNDLLQVFYKVYLNGQLIVDESKLGIVSGGSNLTEGSTVTLLAQNVVDENYAMVVGKKKFLRNHANEIILNFDNASKKSIKMAFRAYDDGVAYRYLVEGIGTFSVSSETSVFKIKDPVKGWLQDWTKGWSYEKVYNATTNLDIGKTLIAFPALFKVTSNKFVFISEANISGNYIGSHLKQDTTTRNVFQIDYESSVSAALPLSTPWRTIIIGDLKTLFESSLVHHLAEPCKLDDVSWIAPGATTFPWLTDHDVNGNQARINQFIDMASEMGWKWLEYDQALVYGDAGADKVQCDLWKSATWIPQVVQYAQSKGIKVYGWHRWGCVDSQAEQNDLLGFFQTNGWGGIKVDFLDSDSQDRLKFSDDIIKECADRKLLVSFHGSSVPRGQQRTWPNIATYESVLGEERYTFGLNLPNPPHNVILCYTRNLLGSMDYTPTTFFPLTGSAYTRVTTDAHEMALGIVFESGWQSFGAAPEELTNTNLAKGFLKNIPTTWDDTKFLDGDPDGFIVVARKKESLWYVAGINTATPRNLSLNLSFIKPGNYSTTLYKDDAALQHVATNSVQINTANPYAFTLPANGGFGFILDEDTNRTAQTITFNPISDKNSTNADFAISATATSGLPVTFSVLSGPATMTSNTVHLAGTRGKVTIVAYQDGNATYASASTNQSFMVMRTGPIALYPLEGNVQDTSGSGNHGVNNGATFVTGKIGGQAGQFNGSNAFVQIPRSIGEANFTIAFWLKTTATAGTGQWWQGQGLVDGEMPGGVNDFGTALVGGKFAFGIGNPDTTLLSAKSVNDGNWRHVAATRDATNGAMRVYVDGVLDGSTNGPTGDRTVPTSLRIGSLQTGAASSFINGAIDHVQIFDRMLNASEIAALATVPPPVLSIGHGSGNSVQIAWQTSDTNFTMQTSSTLSNGAAWTPLTNGIVTVANNSVLTNAINQSAAFFRLYQQ